MNFTLIPVTHDNLDRALSLHISPAQKGTVETVTECWHEALEFPLWRPVIIGRDDKDIGFAMYGKWEGEGVSGRVWLDRFFIDEAFQNQGLAKACLPMLLTHIQQSYACREIFLSVYEDNLPAIGLYKKLGFQFNGELDLNGEKVMVLPINGA